MQSNSEVMLSVLTYLPSKIHVEIWINHEFWEQDRIEKNKQKPMRRLIPVISGNAENVKQSVQEKNLTSQIKITDIIPLSNSQIILVEQTNPLKEIIHYGEC